VCSIFWQEHSGTLSYFLWPRILDIFF
jgi:hypothetical protein